MEELQEFKSFLGPAAEDYTEAQLRQLRQDMQAMAELLLDFYFSKKNADSKKNPRNFDSPRPKP